MSRMSGILTVSVLVAASAILCHYSSETELTLRLLSKCIVWPFQTTQTSAEPKNKRKEPAKDAAMLTDETIFPLLSIGLPVYENPEEAYNTTKMALEAGYRNFMLDVDLGTIRAFAAAVQNSGVPRSDLLIVGSVPALEEEEDSNFQFSSSHYEATIRACRQILFAFATGGVSYLDQMLLDAPPGQDCHVIRKEWQALESLISLKKIRSLAVSNFSPQKLDDCLLNDPDVKVKPVVNQLPFSVAYHSRKKDIIRENNQRGLMVQAWSPLGGSSHEFNDNVKKVCGEIGKQYSKSFAQVALRWIVQKGAAICTRSSNRTHLQEDLNIFDFELSEGDMIVLDALQDG